MAQGILHKDTGHNDSKSFFFLFLPLISGVMIDDTAHECNDWMPTVQINHISQNSYQSLLTLAHARFSHIEHNCKDNE